MTYLPKFITAAVLSTAASLYAGGFWLQLGNAEASPEAKARNAALVIQATGCHDPANATVDGVVIRYVHNRMQTAPVKVLPMKQPGTFAVVRDWPADETVTLEFIGHNSAGASQMTTSVLVRARGNVVERTAAKFYPRVPTDAEKLEIASLVR